METLKSPAMTYIGMAVALTAILSGVFGWLDPAIAWSLGGLFGFGSFAALRSYIDSQGWKSYALAVGVVIPTALLFFKVITLEAYTALLAVATALGGITLQQAQSKANNG